jgi:amidase
MTIMTAQPIGEIAETTEPTETTEITGTSATALARAIRAKDVSSLEVVEAYLRRIERVNPALNAVVQLTADDARRQARAADAALARGDVAGPLHGVPFTAKDALETAGTISTGGTAGRAAAVPERDATAVARLRAAGAILLGKTNVPEFSLAFETDNLIYGATNNPYDLGRTPGGSSGGEAAIIAAGGSPFGVGSDAAGSIRWPAHCCGIAGLKPTTARVPMTGHFPPTVGLGADLWALGPLARHVEDLALVLPIIAGPDGHDPRTVPASLRDPQEVDLSALRVAVSTRIGAVAAEPEVAAVTERAARILAEAGATVEEAAPPDLDQVLDLTFKYFGGDGGAGVRTLLQLAGTTTPSPLIARFGHDLAPFALDAAGLSALLAQLDVFRMGMLGFMSRYDVILCPPNAAPALPHGTTFDHIPGFGFTVAYNLTGWPAAVVRAGTSGNGLPIGVQAVARPWREDVALAVVAHLEKMMGGWRPPVL